MLEIKDAAVAFRGDGTFLDKTYGMTRKWTVRMGMMGLLLMAITSACEKRQLLTGSRDGDIERLQQLRREIDSLTGLYPCEDAREWRFTPIGAKACGGPTDYIAYSTRLDTAAFLKKVEHYTKTNEAYNREWNIASDCMYLMPPSYVVCTDGKAELVWGE